MLHESQTAPQYPLLLDASLVTLGATIANARIGVPDPPPPYGGFLEKAGSPTFARDSRASRFRRSFPRTARPGAFKFPAPYGTTAVRLTNANDCGGTDCLAYVGYSYWRNTNNHVGRPEMLIFLGFDRSAGGPGPSLLSYNKTTDQVQNLGPLFPASSVYSYATGEGWYFSGTQATKLYTFLVGDSMLRRYDVLSHQFEQARRDGSEPLPASRRLPVERGVHLPAALERRRLDAFGHGAGRRVQPARMRRLQVGRKRFQFFAPPAGFELDECHVDKSGNWLMLLEVNPNGVGAEPHRRSAQRHDHDDRRCATDRSDISTWASATRSAPTTTTRCRTRRSC